MKLIKRLNKLITADAHAVLDSIEDPHALLKQAMRDMRMIIEEDESLLSRTSNQQEKLKQQSILLEREQERLNQDLALCFSAENEALARNIVKKKLYLAQRVDLNHSQLLQACEKQNQLQIQIVENQQAYELIAHQAEVLLSELSLQAKQSDLHHPTQLNSVVTEDDIDMALLAEKAKREDL
jgi:phage shock protein A